MTLTIAHPFVLLANIEMYEKSKIDWLSDWFMLFTDVLQFFPAWFIVSILLTSLEAILYIRSRSNREETADVLPTESQTLNPEPIVFSSAPVESRVVTIESIQQYKTIYRFTPEGLSQETLQKSFD